MSLAHTSSVFERHRSIIEPGILRRYRVPLLFLLAVAYALASIWFFSFGTVLSRARWDIAGTYLASWVSWEGRPTVEIAADGTMAVTYPKFSPLGHDPHPDWVVLTHDTITRMRQVNAAAAPAAANPSSGGVSFMVPGSATAGQGSETPVQPANPVISFMAPGSALGGGAVAGDPAKSSEVPAEAVPVTETVDVIRKAVITYDSATRIEFENGMAQVSHGRETARFAITPESVTVEGGVLPSFATQKTPGGKVILSFGFTGWAELVPGGATIRNRFFGWANFLFDPDSPFFNKPASEVAHLILAGDRIDPTQSNLSLAWSNILYNSSWQHLDVWTKLLQTVVMAFMGTLLASLVAFPLSFLAARTITASTPVNQVTKRFFDFQRSVDMLIWALVFTRGFGPGPLAGMAAIFFTDTGTLGKLYSEALENVDTKQPEGVRSVGAHPVSVQRFGVLPQVLPVFASQALYFWESNTRSATIIGAVGAGGIGLKLWEAIRTNSNWSNVCYMVILILLTVTVFDFLSSALRKRLIGTKS